MQPFSIRQALLGLGLCLLTASSGTAAELATLTIHPNKVSLQNADDAAQLIVTGTYTDGRIVDLTGEAKYSISDSKTASVTPQGRVIPQGNGKSEIVASASGKTVRIPLTSEHFSENLPINFGNQIVPIFTKLGCNSGGCHGKASGQNGFKLSLLGFEPELDFQTLVKEGRGRRLFPSSPDASLFLQKAVGQLPHGGGRKLDASSDEYKLIRRWIAAGMPYGSPQDPTVTHISVFPEHRVLARQSTQQFAVYAHYTDGSVEDITRRTQFDSNEQEVATVDGNGLVRTLSHSGEAAIMARYQGNVAVFRATVPLGAKTPEWTFASQTMVDDLTAKKWRELGLVPSALSSDTQFVRRVYLDLTGTLPTPQQVNEFLASKDPKKRDQLVDQLLETPEYSYFFANKWADILRVKRRGDRDRAEGTFAFHNWIREAIAKDMPYSEFVRSILMATGDDRSNPPTVWYKELEKPEQFVDDLTQVFLGQRLTCANCHHHPYEKWSQDDYWGMAAFFGRVGRKQITSPSAEPGRPVKREMLFTRLTGSVTNKRTNKPAVIKPLDAAAIEVSSDDPREKLADWMVDPKNPFFARTVANRYWAHFFGRGIVDPLDDMRITNPPSNPELLNALTKYVTDHKYSLKDLVKVIVKSRTYQLSSTPNEWNKADKQTYARYYPKRLSAEVLLDAVNQVTNSPTQFGGLPKDTNAPHRAIMLPDESFTSYFLEVFGKPQRSSACECERVNEANLAQALHLLNSDEIQGKISRGGGRAELMSKADDKRSDAEKVEEIFLWAFGRKPTADDMKAALGHIEAQVQKSGPSAKKSAYENIVWAVLNTKEFVFNQ